MTKYYPAKNIVISSDFLVSKFCGKTHFPHSLRRIENFDIRKSVKITKFFVVLESAADSVCLGSIATNLKACYEDQKSSSLSHCSCNVVK